MKSRPIPHIFVSFDIIILSCFSYCWR
jgi:hypothetical protein